jgi:carbamoylphosphate synthase small subunit
MNAPEGLAIRKQAVSCAGSAVRHQQSHVSAGRIEISAQNHNYAVDPATLPDGANVSHINLNDGTCAGLLLPTQKARWLLGFRV